VTVPDTFEALAIISFAVLPGAAFIFALERATGAWGVKATDRILRFISLSAILYVLLAPYGYVLYRKYVLSHHLVTAKPFPWVPYLLLIGYLGVLPWLLGTLAGRAINNNHERIGQMFGHQMRPPRAFDYVFHNQPEGYVRMLLNLAGTEPCWVAGSYTTEGAGRRGYVAGYPEDPDIFLPARVACDPDTGEFHRDPGTGEVITQEGGILVKQSQIAYLEFIDR
jgi:hypothetical protein